MSEPELPNLPADVKLLLRADLDAPDPSTAVKDMVRARVASTVASAAVVSSVAVKAGLLSARAWVAVLGTAAIVGVGAASWMWSRSMDTPAPEIPSAPMTRPLPPTLPVPEPVPPASEGVHFRAAPVSPAASPHAVHPSKANDRKVPPVVNVVTEPVVDAVPPVVEEPRVSRKDLLAEEKNLLARAHDELSRSHLQRALDALEEHAAAHPGGQLSEERDALRILTLLRAGRKREAAGHMEAFEKLYPESIFSASINAAVKAAP